MADQDIIRVTRARSVRGTSDLFKLLQVEGIIDAYAEHIASDAAQYALDAVKSSVPIDTGELRSSIYIDKSEGEYRIVIPSTTHDSSRGQNKPTNVDVAKELADSSIFRRSKESDATGGFSPEGLGSPTRGWDLIAQQKFLRRIEEIK